jgi:hypothetical protein
MSLAQIGEKKLITDSSEIPKLLQIGDLVELYLKPGYMATPVQVNHSYGFPGFFVMSEKEFLNPDYLDEIKSISDDRKKELFFRRKEDKTADERKFLKGMSGRELLIAPSILPGYVSEIGNKKNYGERIILRHALTNVDVEHNKRLTFASNGFGGGAVVPFSSIDAVVRLGHQDLYLR